MKIGLSVPQLGPLATREAVRGLSVGAEANGFDSLWVQDHFMWPHHPKMRFDLKLDGAMELRDYRMHDAYRSVMQPMELMAYVAALTERVTIASSVLVAAYFRPLRFARQLATIDVLSGGRLVCGLGLGQNVDEFEQMGAPFDKRGPRTEDMIRALRAAWLDDPVSYDGPFFTIPQCDSSPKPLQRNERGEPAVPILIGAGDSPRAKRRIAEMGDGWIVTGAMTDVDAIVAYRAEVENIRSAAGDQRRVAAYQRAFVLPHLPGVAPATGGPFGPAAWSGTIDALAAKVAVSAEAGIDHLVLDTNYWETCPSPRAWAALADHLAPLVELAHAHDPLTKERGALR